MPIRTSRAVTLAAALCLVLAAPAAGAGGFMHFDDPRPGIQPARSGGGDLQDWRSQYGTGQAPSASRPGPRTPVRPLKPK